MKPIRWALVGASTVAREWMIDAIRQQGDGEIVAVVSRDAERGARFAAEHGIPVSATSLDDVLARADIDAVYISTTNEWHMPQTLACAAAGKHVLCEKPLALSGADARRMVVACDAAGVVLGTNHHLRNAATHRRIHELIKSGEIGQPLCARVFHANFLPPHLQGWRLNSPDAGGGAILDMFVHDADTLRFILDAEPQHVVALATSGNMAEAGLEDSVMAALQFDNGVLVQVHDAFNVPFAGTGLEVHGTLGSIFASDVMTQRPIGEIRLRTASGTAAVPVVHENLYVRSVAMFHAAIRGEGQPSASGEDGVRSLTIALAVQEACRSGQRVSVAY
jgi:1,5-anhydro-D-fructose reductase (1,5-anhydro-D-mannitol-forming)